VILAGHERCNEPAGLRAGCQAGKWIKSPPAKHPFGSLNECDRLLQFLACHLKGRRLQRGMHEQALCGHPIVAKVPDGIIRPRDVLKHQARHFCAFLHASSLPLVADRLPRQRRTRACLLQRLTACSGLRTGNLIRRRPESSFPDTRFAASSFPTQGLRSKVADMDDDGRGTATEATIPLATSCYKKA
jgi:hypothetical protein